MSILGIECVDSLVWCEAIVTVVTPNSGECLEVGERIHEALVEAGIETILDARDERPGVKFAEADRLGIPYRIVVGPRGIAAGVVELKIVQSNEFRDFRIHAAQELAEVVARGVLLGRGSRIDGEEL
jgi:prolyl-tRNA synthetase